MDKRKTSLFILGLSILLLSVVGVTYAYWTLTLEQTDEDNLATSCFDVVLTEENNAINLEKAYPIVDKEGEELTPYTFKLKNKCNANVKYQINLETLNTVGGESIKDKKLADKYIKEKLNEKDKDGSMRLLIDNEEVTPTLEDASESYKLMTGYMTAEDEKTFELRLWMDENITAENTDAMEKTFASKITIVATYAKEAKKTLEETILALDIENKDDEDTGATGLYKVTHDEASITYTTDSFYQKRLTQTEYRYAGKDPNNYVDFGEKVAEDKFELMLCDEEGCINIRLLGLPLESYFNTQEQCETEKTQIENTYGGVLQSMGGILDCQQIAAKGDSLYWRIIGLVNTPEGQRVKLVKDASIGGYSWDSSDEDINLGAGINEWSQSDLMKLLNPGYETNKDQICEEDQCTNDNLVNNSLYWDGGKGKCYTFKDNIATDCDFTNNTIPENLKNMIDTVTWNTGSDKNWIDDELLDVNKFYEYERSSNTGDICKEDKGGNGGSNCTDQVNRTTSWNGKVGLIYPSDYGYSTSGIKDATTRKTCLSTALSSWYSHSSCYENNWLLPSEVDGTLSPVAFLDVAYDVFSVNTDGRVAYSYAYNAEATHPSVYLKPDVFVTQRDGSQINPYILET